MIITAEKGSGIHIQYKTAAVRLEVADAKTSGNILIASKRGFFDAEKKQNDAFYIDQPGEYELMDVFVYGIASDNEENPEDTNVMYKIDAEELVLLYLGRLSHDLHTAQLEALGNIDILMVPIDGEGALPVKDVLSLIKELEPRVIMPVANGKDFGSGLEQFCKEMGCAGQERISKYKIVKKDLQNDETKIVIVNPS